VSLRVTNAHATCFIFSKIIGVKTRGIEKQLNNLIREFLLKKKKNKMQQLEFILFPSL